MKRGLLLWSLVAAAPLLAQAPAPPVAKKVPHVTTPHGYTVQDDYFWLRGKQKPEVIAYLKAEDNYANAMMRGTEALQDTLYREMLGRVKQTDENVPYRRDGYLYYNRTVEGKQYPIYARRRGSMSAPEEVVLDLNILAKGRAFVGLGSYQPSDDGNLLAYSIDTTGFRQYVLFVKDLRTGKVGPPVAVRVDEVAWATDGKTLMYSQEDAITKRAYRVYRRALAAPRPVQVYEDKDDLYELSLTRTRSKGYFLIESASATTSDVHYIRADRPTDAVRVISPRQDGREYYVDHAADKFYIRVNDTGRNFRLVTAPVSAPGETNWTELVAERSGTMLEEVDCFSDHLVTTEREDGLARFRIRGMDGAQSGDIDFPEPAYSADAGRNEEFATGTFRFNYESLVTPQSVFDYEIEAHTRTLLRQQPVLGGYDPTQYRTERLWAIASDGTQVPISIVYRLPLDRNGQRPMLLNGYGSYGVSEDVQFSSARLSLLDRGFLYGVAHVRGGGEMGKAWHDDGKMMTKRNTFTDFIASATMLEHDGYTSASGMVITGGSAGGLLMGAVTNMRPDLFRAVVTYVPFVDVMNTMLDASLPLTTGEYLEWGNPNEKPAYDYMRSYSPYDNVVAQAYPALLVRTSLNDSQVPYWESAKYVARLRAVKTDSNVLIFKVKLQPGGHGGASGRYDRLHDLAFDYAFILEQVKLQ